MGFFSSVGDFFGRVGSAIASGVSKVYQGVKSVVSKAVNWMAEKAETFIGKVSRVWEVVKTYVKPALKIIQLIPWPPLQAAAKALEKAITFVERLEKTVLATKLGKAIHWTINAAQKIKTYIMDEKERREALERKEVFVEAKQLLNDDEYQAIQMAEIINEFILVQSEIQVVFDKNSIDDFEHYLRLRATQKLLAITEKALKNGQDINAVGKGDLFLLEVGRELLKPNPKLDDSALDMLNGLITKRYGKNLIPFVFEEMIIAWSKNLSALELQWEEGNKTLAKDIVNLRNLENNLKFDVKLEEDEEKVLKLLKKSVPALKTAQEKLNKEVSEMRNYVYAAEGFLQILEENEKLNNKEYLIEEGGRVGKIIIDCAQYGKKWEELTVEEQGLIIDFSNIFREASKEREKLILVEGAA